MNIWNSIPFMRLLIAFLSGILLSINFHEVNRIHWLCIPACLLIAFLFSKQFKNNFSYQYLRGIPLLLFLLFAGIQITDLHREINYPGHFSKQTGSAYVLKIAEPPKHKEKTLKATAEVIAVKVGKKWFQTTGKLLVYLKKDTRSIQLQYGDIIVSKSKIVDCPPPKNPFEFNYKKYLSFHQIYQQTYLTDQNWIETNRNEANTLLALSYRIRNYLLKIISDAGVKDDEYAIGTALILGYEDHLSTEVIGAFAATGALHVLSVSGLHVGIVFLVINFFLKFLGESNKARIIIFFISISALWLYALITGMSPSVWRAAAMFSLISLGKLLRRDVNTFNIIACSAFLLLCINPFMITEVGFQLSYLAVIGIVGIYPMLYESYFVKNKWLEKIWAVTCISIAAQLITFPLGLLYFHQFPNYFIVSNLVIIPISTLILYAGIVLLVFSKIPGIGMIAGKILYFLLWLLKETVDYFENLPFAIIDEISITTPDTFMIYGILIAVFIYLKQKKLVYLHAALAITLVFTGLQILEKIEQQKQQKIVIYAVNKHHATDFINGNQSVLIADKLLLNDKDKMRFHLLPNKINHGIKFSQHLSSDLNMAISSPIIAQKGNYLIFKDKIVINTAMQVISFKELNYLPSIVLLNKMNVKKFDELFKLFPSSAYICDGSISSSFFKKIRQEHPHLNIRSVLDEGAITIDI